MGEDGHFASIFPEMITEKNSINPEGFPEILTTKPLGCPKYSRITMNLPLILQSKSIFLLVHGEKKINTLKLAQSNLTLPVSSLLSAAREKLIIDKINT